MIGFRYTPSSDLTYYLEHPDLPCPEFFRKHWSVFGRVTRAHHTWVTPGKGPW